MITKAPALAAELQSAKEMILYLRAALSETIRQRGPGRSEKCFTCRQQFQIYPGDTPKYMLPHGGMPQCPDCWTEARVQETQSP